MLAEFLCILIKPEQNNSIRKQIQHSFNDFRNADTVGYHNILKQRVWYPMLKDRDDYYSGLLIDYRHF